MHWRVFSRQCNNACTERSSMVEGKKGDERSEEARTRILDAAQTLFAAHGFNATTTKAIAEHAEVPGGLIFYYFPTKQALLASVLSERNILVELRCGERRSLFPIPGRP